jgi:hypothetical protein
MKTFDQPALSFASRGVIPALENGFYADNSLSKVAITFIET